MGRIGNKFKKLGFRTEKSKKDFGAFRNGLDGFNYFIKRSLTLIIQIL